MFAKFHEVQSLDRGQTQAAWELLRVRGGEGRPLKRCCLGMDVMLFQKMGSQYKKSGTSSFHNKGWSFSRTC